MRRQSFTFGPFELNSIRFELRRRGVRIRLSPALTRLLLLFVRQPGELITRDAIVQCLWTEPRSVDVTNGINTAINRLRNTLGDDPNRPRYLETVIGLGYRFIATVEVINLDGPFTSGTEAIEPDRSQPTEEPQQAPVVFVASSSPSSEDMQVSASQSPESVSPVRKGSLVSAPERVAGGARQVVSRWLLVVGTAVLAAVMVWWLRSGSSLPAAKQQSLSKGELNLIQATFNDSDNPIFAAAVSHTGSSFAYSDDSGVSVRTIDTGAEQILRTPSHLRVYQMQWLPDDSGLIASGLQTSTGGEQVWSLSLHNDSAQLLIEEASGAAISPDGSRLAFLRHHGQEIWTSSIAGKYARSLISVAQEDTFSSLAWTWTGDEILCLRRRLPTPDPRGEDYADRRAFQDLTLIGTNGAEIARWPDLKLISPNVRRDGWLFFLQSDSPYNHPDPRLMVAHLSSSSPKVLAANPRRIDGIDADDASGFSLSDDGGRFGLVLERRSAGIYVDQVRTHNDTAEGIHKLSHPAPDNYPHAWTAASDAVIFESNSLGPYAIFKQKIDGSPAELLARSDGDSVFAQVSPDGEWVLFENYVLKPKYRLDGIFRVSVNGGKIERLTADPSIDGFQCSASPKGRCVLRQRIANEWVYSALDPVRGQTEELRRTAWQDSFLGDWSVSPDGLTVALPFHGPHETGIRLLPLSQPAVPNRQSPPNSSKIEPYIIPVKIHGEIVQVSWAVDGRHFFAEVKANDGYSLVSVDPTGKATVLRKSEAVLWAVPSRDGKLVATVGQDSNSNVWLGTHLPFIDAK